MLSWQTIAQSTAPYNLDRQTLLLLGALAFMLAIWLLYRILRNRPMVESNAAAESSAESTMMTRVPPPPLPKVEKILSRLEGEYPEFCSIVREVQKYSTLPALLAQTEVRRGFAHLETLLLKTDRLPAKGTLGIQSDSMSLSGETRRDAKATMLTVIRLIQDVDGVREKSGPFIDEQLDSFLERI
jgi:hypothetical protein